MYESNIQPRKLDGSDIAEEITKMESIPQDIAQRMVDQYREHHLFVVPYYEGQPTLQYEARRVLNWYLIQLS